MSQARSKPEPKPEPDELDLVAAANRRAKGKRPYFLDDPAVERVLSITMSVATELAVARERIDTLERLLVQRGVLLPGDIDHYEPDAAAQDERHAWGRAFIARVLRIVDQDVQAMAQSGEPSTETSIEQLMDELGRHDDPPNS